MFKHLTLAFCAGALFTTGCVLTTDDTSTNSDSDPSAPLTGGTTVELTGGTTVEEPTGGTTEGTATGTATGTTEVSGTTVDVPTSEPTTDGPLTSTTGEGTTDQTTGGGLYGNCGWNDRGNYYACPAEGGVPGLEDPDGLDPIACDGTPVADADCGMGEPVSDLGCCTPEGVLYFCTEEGKVFEQDCSI
jgi:hypothetical protein